MMSSSISTTVNPISDVDSDTTITTAVSSGTASATANAIATTATTTNATASSSSSSSPSFAPTATAAAAGADESLLTSANAAATSPPPPPPTILTATATAAVTKTTSTTTTTTSAVAAEQRRWFRRNLVVPVVSVTSSSSSSKSSTSSLWSRHRRSSKNGSSSAASTSITTRSTSRMLVFVFLATMLAYTTWHNQQSISQYSKSNTDQWYDYLVINLLNTTGTTTTMSSTDTNTNTQPKQKQRIVVQRSRVYSDRPRQTQPGEIHFVGANEPPQINVTVPQDPLRRSLQTTSQQQQQAQQQQQSFTDSSFLFRDAPHFPLYPRTQYLGVLVDAGRYYFPLPWLYRLVDVLQVLHYNLIHFRLTDDQCFNVILDSHPELAYPCPATNRERLVYTADELRAWNAYARQRGISIMPEVNVPGHAAGWGGAGLVVPCPHFICGKAYGVPLNIYHPNFRTILTNVIAEVVDIFDQPTFLHLGGDEFTMAMGCLQEAGITNDLMSYYQEFEYMLGSIINETGYPEEQVVRWEMTGYDQTPGLIHLQRAGGLEHLWYHLPPTRKATSLANRRYTFSSAGLYFDTNQDDNAADVYRWTHKTMRLTTGHVVTALIAGTFELSAAFWYDRNVLGKLIAVAMGAANTTLHEYQAVHNIENNHDKVDIVGLWERFCYEAGFGEKLCGTHGRGVISHYEYKEQWHYKKSIWDSDVCHHLAALDAQGTTIMRNPVPPFYEVVGMNDTSMSSSGGSSSSRVPERPKEQPQQQHDGEVTVKDDSNSDDNEDDDEEETTSIITTVTAMANTLWMWVVGAQE